MDIIDVLLARAMTPQGQIQSYAALAQQAVSQASEATSTANAAAETAAQASQNLSQITSDISAAANTQIDNLAISLTQLNASTLVSNNIEVAYPSGKQESLNNIVKYYKQTGSNEDGTMTQKAITEALARAGGGSAGNLGPENAGKIVVVDENGNVVSSQNVSEEELMTLLSKTTPEFSQNTVSVTVDYADYSYIRGQDAENAEAGTDFDKYPMYGGRTRCLVNDEGRIIAFYGDNDYTDTPTNGYQVMVYQPKFYYKRTPVTVRNITGGQAIDKEILMISSTLQNGFKVHPLFINENNEQVSYVLLPAYQGSIESSNETSYTDNAYSNFTSQKLASVSNANPITGRNNQLTASMAETLANNRGNGWHITNLRFESAMQMLETVEFGSYNSQLSLQKGISDIEINSADVTSITGSTSGLGNTSGAATSTTFVVNGTTVTYSEAGKRAISYRGMQNPWGGTWRIVGGVNVIGNGQTRGGIPYICKNYSYNVDSNSNYDSVGFSMPNGGGWLYRFGYGNSDYDWVFIPIENGNGASSAVPIGDNIWVTQSLNGTNCMTCGGAWAFGLENGAFYYACDHGPRQVTTRQNARLMYIPHLSDTYYTANITAWINKYGG